MNAGWEGSTDLSRCKERQYVAHFKFSISSVGLRNSRLQKAGLNLNAENENESNQPPRGVLLPVGASGSLGRKRTINGPTGSGVAGSLVPAA